MFYKIEMGLHFDSIVSFSLYKCIFMLYYPRLTIAVNEYSESTSFIRTQFVIFSANITPCTVHCSLLHIKRAKNFFLALFSDLYYLFPVLCDSLSQPCERRSYVRSCLHEQGFLIQIIKQPKLLLFKRCNCKRHMIKGKSPQHLHLIP